MNLLDKFLGTDEDPQPLEIESAFVDDVDRSFSGNQGASPSVLTLSGEFSGPMQALQVPTVFACVRNIAEDVAKLPLEIFERGEKDGRDIQTKITDGPSYRVASKNTSDGVTAFTFWQTMYTNAMLWGNGLAEIVRNSRGEVVQQHVIHPSRVRPGRRKNGERFYRINLQDGTFIDMDAQDVLHIRGFGDESWGWSITQAMAARTIGTSLAESAFSASFWNNGSFVGAVLQHPKTLSEEAQRRLRSGLQKVAGGARNAARVLVLEEGMEYAPLTMPLRDAQFIEGKNLNIEDLARVFRVPLHKIGHLKQASKNNIEQQGKEYLDDTMEPWLKRGETEMDYKYYPHSNKRWMRWNRDNFTRGTLKDRTDSYTKLFQMGMLNSNEGRALEGRNPIENGDTYFVQLNLIPLDQAVDMAASLNGQRDNRRQVDDNEQARLGDVHEVFEAYFFRAVGGINTRYNTLSGEAKERCKISLLEAVDTTTVQYFSFLRLSTDDALEVSASFRQASEFNSGNTAEQFLFMRKAAETLIKKELQHA